MLMVGTASWPLTEGDSVVLGEKFWTVQSFGPDCVKFYRVRPGPMPLATPEVQAKREKWYRNRVLRKLDVIMSEAKASAQAQDLAAQPDNAQLDPLDRLEDEKFELCDVAVREDHKSQLQLLDREPVLSNIAICLEKIEIPALKRLVIGRDFLFYIPDVKVEPVQVSKSLSETRAQSFAASFLLPREVSHLSFNALFVAEQKAYVCSKTDGVVVDTVTEDTRLIARKTLLVFEDENDQLASSKAVVYTKNKLLLVNATTGFTCAEFERIEDCFDEIKTLSIRKLHKTNQFAILNECNDAKCARLRLISRDKAGNFAQVWNNLLLHLHVELTFKNLVVLDSKYLVFILLSKDRSAWILVQYDLKKKAVMKELQLKFGKYDPPVSLVWTDPLLFPLVFTRSGQCFGCRLNEHQPLVPIVVAIPSLRFAEAHLMAAAMTKELLYLTVSNCSDNRCTLQICPHPLLMSAELQ
jgi:hypothetical protein